MNSSCGDTDQVDFLQGLTPWNGGDSNAGEIPWGPMDKKIPYGGIMLRQNLIPEQPGRLALSTETDIETQVISLLGASNPISDTKNLTLH